MRTTFLIVLASSPSLLAALAPMDLRTEWLPEPLAVEAEKPRLSWRVEESNPAVRGQKQTAYRVLAASTREALAKDSGDLWDSGKVASGETLNVEYGGKPLGSGQQVFWKLCVWDKDGVQSAWSAPTRFAMGLLKPDDWKAQWISFKDDAPLPSDRGKLHLPPARHYRKTITPGSHLKRATLYVSALGIADVYLDGNIIGDDTREEFFAPGWSDYHRRAYYRAYDLTFALQSRSEGSPRYALGVVVADGWYAGYVGYGLLVGYGPNKTGRNIYGKTPALLAQLELEYDDGKRETIGTDTTWEQSGDGPIREADLIMGESYDARRAILAWASSNLRFPDPNIKAEPWRWAPAILATDNGSTTAKFFEPGVERVVELGFQKPPKLVAYTAPPIRVIQELPARKVAARGNGTFIFDFGENFAGNVRLRFKGEPGQKLTLRFGEMLHPDGRLMTENLRRARATDTYICSGEGVEVWTPRFTYHGFQFAELSGLTPAQGEPPLSTLTGLVLSNDTPYGSSFECSDPVMTQFWKNTVRTQKANFIEIPTDCPQRDERLGWMGDAQIYARTATYNADVAAFYTKWMGDVREAQRPSGAYPDYAPYPFAHGAPGATHGTAWTDAGIIVPWTAWKVYSDRRLIEQHWDSMVKFMGWRAVSDPELKGVKIGNTWGDWLNVNEDTPIEFVDLCYHAYSARLMSEMAAALGKTEKAEKYWERHAAAIASFEKQYLKPDGTLAVDTQTAYVLALWIGMTSGGTDKLAARLAAKIAENGYRMATGFLGTKPLLSVLTQHGHHDLACRLFQSRKFPSWGYEVEQGATSVWERWDSFTREHGFNGASGKNNAAMNSFSHYAFGAVMEWAFHDLAGISLTDGQLSIRPRVPSSASNPDGKPLDWVRASYQHPLGKIAASWKRANGKIEVEVVVPANLTATLNLPGSSGDAATESGKPLSSAGGVTTVHAEGKTRIEIGSGTYRFKVSE